MRLSEESVEEAGPDLTPVIDVVFLLLIFFLVATEYHQEERELDVFSRVINLQIFCTKVFIQQKFLTSQILITLMTA